MGENKKKCKYCGSLMDIHENVCIHCGTIDNSLEIRRNIPLKITLFSSAMLVVLSLFILIILFTLDVNIVW